MFKSLEVKFVGTMDKHSEFSISVYSEKNGVGEPLTSKFTVENSEAEDYGRFSRVVRREIVNFERRELAKKLEACRVAVGMNREEAAEFFNTTRQNIYRLEKGLPTFNARSELLRSMIERYKEIKNSNAEV